MNSKTLERIIFVAIIVLLGSMLLAKSSGKVGVVRDATQFGSDVYIPNTLEVGGLTTVSSAASSTLLIGTGTNTGCLEMGNAGGSGTVFVTVASSTITATTTKPAACK